MLKRLFVLAVLMLTARGGASSEVSLDFQISPDNTGGVGPPTVAAGIKNYLVAWTDLSGATPQLYASVVTQSQLASVPIQLSTNTGASVHPYSYQRIEAAFDGQSNWLVVWMEDDTSSSAICGALVSAVNNGVNVLPGTIVASGQIASVSGTVEAEPLVAFNGSDFVVAWMDRPTGASSGSQICFCRVSTSGTAGIATTIPGQTTPVNQALLFLAPQPSGDVLLIYRETKETPAATRGARISANGALRDSEGITLFLESETGGGYGDPIGATFVNSEWEILSSFNQLQDSSIYLHHLSTAGVVTPPQGVFATMGLGPTGKNADEYAPAVAGANGWLFLRNDRVNSSLYHILGKRVGLDGTDMDPIPVQIDTATQGVLYDAVAAEYDNVFLVVWSDGRNGSSGTASAANIFGAMVDMTAASGSGAALMPMLTASPTSGIKPPLTVTFTASATGDYDSMSLDFGDGATTTDYSIPHTYKKIGNFLAQLTMTKGSYEVFKTVLISIGTNKAVETIGVPVKSSEGLAANMFIDEVAVSLDFTTTYDDAAQIVGILDPSALPLDADATLAGALVTVTLGSNTYRFHLDAKGSYKSDSSEKPRYKCALSPTTGEFSFLVFKEDLQDGLKVLGAKNPSSGTLKSIVEVPVDVTATLVNGTTFSATSTVGLSYKAKHDLSGNGQYVFSKKGETVSGCFVVSKFSASEQGKSGQVTHTFSITGQLVRPNGVQLKPAATGYFTFGIGNYSCSISVENLKVTGKTISYTAKASVSGLQKFAININTGVFSLQLAKIPAHGTGGSGMPVANEDNVINAHLNLSFLFNLADQELDAGRYIAITRKNASAKKWKPPK